MGNKRQPAAKTNLKRLRRWQGKKTTAVKKPATHKQLNLKTAPEITNNIERSAEKPRVYLNKLTALEKWSEGANTGKLRVGAAIGQLLEFFFE